MNIETIQLDEILHMLESGGVWYLQGKYSGVIARGTVNHCLEAAKKEPAVYRVDQIDGAGRIIAAYSVKAADE